MQNNMKGAFKVTLNTCRSFTKYDQLVYGDCTKIFEALLPFKNCPKYQQARATYEQLGDDLRNHLIQSSTIPDDSTPMMSLTLSIHKHILCGFEILVNCVRENSPQLGGHGIDAETKVNQLALQKGESIQDLYRCTIDLIYDINLLQDKSGQKNKVTGKFIKILFNQNTAIESIISPYFIAWNKFS
eukprot:883682-Ditylum_brightwellii.AAC.1